MCSAIGISDVPTLWRDQSLGRRTSFRSLHGERPILERKLASHERRLGHFLFFRSAQREIRLRPLLLSRTRRRTERHPQRFVERAERSRIDQWRWETRERKRRWTSDVKWERDEEGVHRSANPVANERSTATYFESLCRRRSRSFDAGSSSESLPAATTVVSVRQSIV